MNQTEVPSPAAQATAQSEPPADSLPSLMHRLNAAERELAELKEQLTQSQRLATIGTITAVIAHEFNNLLTPIISYSQYALSSAESDQPDNELIRKALGKSFNGATKAGRICSSMLGLARGESEPTTVAVQSLVDETLLVLARDPQKDGIALRVQIQPDLSVRGDPVQLEQVLLNLLINARQAMAGRAGSITIKAGLEETNGTAEGTVRLNVVDTGPGIEEQNIGRIFEPFYTTRGTARRGETRGTGLGLAICRQIMTHHGGSIDVESEPGRGTNFTLRLPSAV